MKAQEIFYILLFGLILLGPQRLPGVARKLGSWANELRKAATDLRTGLEAEVGDISKIKQEITQPVKDIQRDMRAPLTEARRELEKPVMEMQAVGDSIKGATSALPKAAQPVAPDASAPPPILRWIGPIPPGSEPVAGSDSAPPLRWVGPAPVGGPTAADAAQDLAEIERTGQVLSDEGERAT